MLSRNTCDNLKKASSGAFMIHLYKECNLPKHRFLKMHQ